MLLLPFEHKAPKALQNAIQAHPAGDIARISNK